MCIRREREGERKIGFHFVCKVSGVDVIFCSKGILWFNFLHTLGPDGKYYLSLFPRLRLVKVKSVAPSKTILQTSSLLFTIFDNFAMVCLSALVCNDLL